MPHVEASVRSRQLIAAARSSTLREGVAKTTLRAVAAEGGVPLGTLQYVFPSKEKLLQAVIEDVIDEIAEVLQGSVRLDEGLVSAIENGLTTFWSRLVSEDVNLQIVQYELTTYALRTPGQQGLARRQYERYAEAVAAWFEQAARNAGEVSAVPFDMLARVLLAGVDGLIIQYICDPDDARARAGLDALAQMLVAYARVGPADGA